MPTSLKYASIAVRQLIASQQLPRTPEPQALMEDEKSVANYDSAFDSKMVVVYATVMEVLHQALPVKPRETALDLASGPGHATLMLKRYLGFNHVVGMDLSEPMQKTAAKNAKKFGIADSVQFIRGDITRLSEIKSDTVQLTTCMDAAHHLPDLSSVKALLNEMDRVTQSSGFCFLMDLIRPKTAKIAEDFIDAVGGDYTKRGLDSFYEDFRNSVYAGWTTKELCSACPNATKRDWYAMGPVGLPAFQMILGLPKGQKSLHVHRENLWRVFPAPIPKDVVADWNFLRLALRLGKLRRIRSGSMK